MDANAIEQFKGLILQLMEPDNEKRSQGESVYSHTKQEFPGQLLLSLVQLSTTPNTEGSVRNMSLIMLRQELVRSDNWVFARVSAEIQEHVKKTLLSGLQQEENELFSTRLKDVISALASSLLSEGQWGEILPFLLELAGSSAEIHRIAAMDIFSHISTRCRSVLIQSMNVMVKVLQAGLLDDSVRVRVAAFGTGVGLLSACRTQEEQAPLQPLFPGMLQSIALALNSGDMESANQGLDNLVALCERETDFVRPSIYGVYKAMVSIMGSEEVDERTRHLAMECPVTLAEARPALCRKIPDFLEGLIPVLLEWNSHLEDNERWNDGEKFDAEDLDVAIAEDSIDRLSIALGGETFAPIMFSAVQQTLQHPNWRVRHSGLMAMSVSAEGSAKYLRDHLDQVVAMVVPFFKDEHPRVRWAACNCIAQMSSDFGRSLTERYHGEIVPVLVTILADPVMVNHPRVLAHAASAVINFSESSEKEFLLPYLKPLLEGLHKLLTMPRIAQEQGVTAVAAVADCVSTEFTPYYDFFVPYMKEILHRASGTEYRMLRGKAMECLSLLGVAVGKEKFYNDAKEVIQVLQTTERNLTDDDPQANFILHAWARLCKCLGEEFQPYLETIMPRLLNSANLDLDFQVHSTEAAPTEAEEGWEFLPVGEKTIAIKTSTLEEKATACNMLYWYAEELKGSFFPYVQPVAQIMVPSLLFYYHDGVRTAAASVMPALLRSTVDHAKATGQGPEVVAQLWNFICPTLIQSIEGEIDTDCLILLIESFGECVNVLGAGCLSHEQQAGIAKAIQQRFETLMGFRQKRMNAQAGGEDFDKYEAQRLEELTNRDDDVIAQIADCTGKLLKHMKMDYMAHFALYGKNWLYFLESGARSHDTQMALCVLDDVAEYLQGNSAQIIHDVYPHFLRYSQDGSPEVRQAACYGLGVFAQYHGQVFAQVARPALEALANIVQSPGAREGEFAIPTDNAISSITKINLYQRENIDPNVGLEVLLSVLPVLDDKDESDITYNNFLTLLEKLGANAFGQSCAHVPKILFILSSPLGTEFVNEPTTHRIKAYFQSVSNQDANMFTQAVGSIPQDNQQKIQAMM